MEKKELQSSVNFEREKITKTIEMLEWFKNNFTSEIPKEILCGVSPDKNYKVRKNWWNGLISTLGLDVLPLLSSMQHSSLIKEINNFMKTYTSKPFRGDRGRLTTERDIDWADSLINRIIEVLKKQL